MEFAQAHTRLALAQVLLFLVAAVGCEGPTGAVAEGVAHVAPVLTAARAHLEMLQEQRGPGGRKDTPWERMSDAELAHAVAEANGKVMIGFKDSALVAGVTNSGIVVASAEARERGRALARSLGVTVLRELKYTPTIIASDCYHSPGITVSASVGRHHTRIAGTATGSSSPPPTATSDTQERAISTLGSR